ncbi:hypothetical protein FGF1_14200 [Flavobacteriaceae bacterium GF1]
MSELRPIDIEDFWIRVYLNPKEDLFSACADRAYRDLNRTLRGLRAEQTKTKYIELRRRLMDLSNLLLVTGFNCQDSFDDVHKNACQKLIRAFNREYKFTKMTIGQAQKWINMYLKYLFALGEQRILGISKNSRYFHVPVDGVIQMEFEKDAQISPLSMPWSKIDEYDTYLSYQKRIRQYYINQIPLEVELKLFNRASSDKS